MYKYKNANTLNAFLILSLTGYVTKKSLQLVFVSIMYLVFAQLAIY